ncbi:BTB domain-containing protein [Nephila pilipes]|uniref:BTB domain-containing protein n=1 Tax=Nephila pilipes TaxID=299642 RepID=A0A8X6NE50_NEPPI|nr:BTB domain-containing protein [Nephila pilipes]
MEFQGNDAEEKDKRRGSNIQNAVLRMYEQKVNTDVKICTENSSVCFSAHKLILAARSSVFADMFWNDREDKPETIKIEGVSKQLLALFLWYIYSDELKTNSPDELTELAKLAQRYEVGGLVRACKHHLTQHLIDKNNVFSVIEAAKYFKLEHILSKCSQFIHSECPIGLFEKNEFLKISHDTLLYILKHRSTSNKSDAYVMEGVICWLQHHNKRDRSLLSELNIFSLNCDEFLDLVEKFPTFFTSREISWILSNIIRPGLMNLPPWCKNNSFSCDFSTEQSILDKNSFSVDYRSMVSTSLEIKTYCHRAFLSYCFYEEDGFDGIVVFEIKISNSFPLPTYLVMLELAFGSSYAPTENLELELFCYEQSAVLKKKKISFSLHVDRDHYYVMVNRQMQLQKNHPFVFSLKLRVSGLTKWGKNGPVSNRQFRVAKIPQDIFYNIQLDTSGHKSVCLTPLSDWMVFIDPTCGDKRPIITSMFFNSCFKSKKNNI